MATSPLRDQVSYRQNAQPGAKELAVLNEDAGQFVRGVRSSADQMSAGSYADDALDAELGGKQAAVETALRRHSALQQRAAETGPRVQRASDINSVGDLGDWAAGTLGSAAATMAPSVAGALLLRRAGKIGSFGGAYAPAYAMERNEAISNQYNDPEQLKASAQERSNVAAAKGGVNAALESIVPAGIGGALFRKPVGSFLGGVGRSVATEAATEAAQEGTGFLAQKHLNQSKEFNPVDILDAAAAGAVGGGGMSMAGQAPGRLLNAVTPTGAGGALDAAGNAVSGAAGSVRDAARAGVERFGPSGLVNGAKDLVSAGVDAVTPGPDTLGGKFGDLASAVAARAAPSVDRAAEGAKKMGEKASTAAGAALDRMTEATKTSETPVDFVRQVFGSSLEDQAANDLNPTSPDALRGDTELATGSNMDRDTADRVGRAARFADDLMTDPATPQSVRDRIEAMEGNFEDEGNRAFLSRSLVAMRGGQKLRSAVDRAAEALKGLSKTTTELGKAAAAGGKEGAKSVVDSTVDRVVKKNLQSATEAENNAFGKVIFDNLTDAAKTDGYVRAQLAQVTNAVMAFAAKTGDMTESDMKALSRMADVMTLFKDPDALLAQLVEYGALPRTSDSFLSRIKAITSAQQDVEQANSFLLSSITPEVADDMKGPELKELARVVDSFGNDSMSKEQSDQLIEGLGHVFGTPENARVVLDYYYQQNRANLRFDPDEGESANADQDMGRTVRSSDDMSVDELEGFGKLTEQDSSELRPRFRTPNPNRPFLKGRDDAALQEAVGKAGDLAQVASMLDYVRGNDDINAKFAAGDIRRDLAKRLNGHLARDEASLQEAIGMYEAHLEEVEGTEDANEVRSMLFALRKRLEKAEDRSSIVKPLQEEIKAQERAMSEALKAGKDPDEALLELYSVVMASKSDHAADDGQMRKFRELLDRTSGSQSAAAKENNALIRKTSVPLMVNGNKTAVSLESMIYNSPVQGSLVERLMASMSLVAGRADTLPVVPADAIVKRDYYGKGQHLTWGGLKKLSPKFRTEERRPEFKKRKQTPEEAQTAAEVRAMRDEISASGMRSYLKSLPAETDGLEVGVDMLSRVERAYDTASAQIEAFEQEGSRVPPELFEKVAQLASKRRILKAFVKENLDSDFPVDRETLLGGLDAWRQEDGIVDKAEDKTEHDNILLAEAQMSAYRARYRAVKGTSFAKEFYGKAKELADELDNKLSRTVDFKRMSVEDRPSGRPNSIRTSKTADPKAADQTRADLVAELDRVKAQSEKDFRAFVEPDSFSEAQAEQKKLGVPAYNAKYNKLAAQYKAERVKRIQETLDRSAPRPKTEPAGERVGAARGDADADVAAYKAVVDSVENSAYEAVERAAIAKYGKDADIVKVMSSDDALNDMYEREIARIGGAVGYAEAKAAVDEAAASAVAAAEQHRAEASRKHNEAAAAARSRGHRRETEVVARYQKINDKVVREAYAMSESELNDEIRRTQYRYDRTPVSTSADGVDQRSYIAMDLDALKRVRAERFAPTKKSKMGPIHGNATSVMTNEEKARIVAEVVRMRGADIKVAFAKYADIKGSGDFSMNPDRTERLIRIAISSLNPTSVAWHESLHDFFSMLGNTKEERALKDSLLKAADDPFMIEKLKNLLKDHPAAVDQVTVDPEERLAYMFQFWAEGALELKPAVSNKFTRFMQFIRDMLGIVTADQKTDAVFQALFDGKFAEQSLVPAVLADMKLNTLGDKLDAVSGPLGVMASNAMTGATDRLRRTHVPALAELADMFHREPGRETGARTFMQERAQTVGKRLNQLQKILENTSSEDRARAIENMQAMRAPSSPLERQLAAYLEEMRGYMNVRGVKQFNSKTKEWVPMKRVKNYFPRVWDKNAIRNNEAGFMALMEPHIGRLQARATYEALINGDGSLELAESEHSLGFTPWNPAVLDRQFTFINPSNAADFAAFQSKDLASIMTSYTQRGIHRAEYASFFGNNGETITKKFLEAQKQGATTEDLAMARKATMALEGTLGYDTNPQLKELMAGIMTYQNILLLPLSLFTNLVDPLGIALKSGDMKEAWHAFTYGIKGLVDQVRGAGPDAQTEIAMMLGIVDEQNMLDAMGQVYNSMHMSSFMKKVNSKFFRYNGMEMWNQRMRVAGMGAAERFILTNMEVLNRKNALADPFHPKKATKVASEKVLANAKRYLDELGITSKDVVLTPDGRLSLTKEQFEASGMSKTEALEAEKRIQAAMFKWVDGAVLRPNAAHRPIWGSDPRFQLVMHLKQFTFSFQNVILRRVGEEMKHGNMLPGFILASYVPFMFAADVLKGSLTGTVQTTSDLFSVASNSIGRSGILGTGVFGSDAMEDVHRGNLPGTSFAGPAFSHLMTLLNGLMGRGSMEQVLDRSVPLMKYF